MNRLMRCEVVFSEKAKIVGSQQYKIKFYHSEVVLDNNDFSFLVKSNNVDLKYLDNVLETKNIESMKVEIVDYVGTES